MGLFDKVKSNIDSAVEKTKDGVNNLNDKQNEYNEKKLEKLRRKKEEKINNIRSEFNIYEGIDCVVYFPQEELVLKSHGGVTRGVATLGFGLVGLAATSGVKQKKQKIRKRTSLQIADKGIVFKKVTDDGKDLRIPYDNIISFNVLTQKFGKKERILINHYELLLLENQSLMVGLSLNKETSEIITPELVDIINERATGKDNEEEGWGLDYANNKLLTEVNDEEIPTGFISTTDELEKIVQMYERGLLSDEEFASMKKKIIEN